ncbi:MAG: hypothetical protein GXY74_12920 [Phycisphaerae bacterium]|nr:hypothetical protein [Phycisphaerae bacterium]
MGDIRNHRVLYLKAGLLLLLGALASALIVLDRPAWKTVLLLAVAVWAFARAYYFAFYVIQHYVDDRFRFAGILSFLRYLFRKDR